MRGVDIEEMLEMAVEQVKGPQMTEKPLITGLCNRRRAGKKGGSRWRRKRSRGRGTRRSRGSRDSVEALK